MVETEDNDNALARVCACNASGQILMDRQGEIWGCEQQVLLSGGDFTLCQAASFSPFRLQVLMSQGFLRCPLGMDKIGRKVS